MTPTESSDSDQPADDSKERTVIDFAGHLHPSATSPDEITNRPLTTHLDPLEQDPTALANWYADAGFDGAVLSQPYYMGHSDAEQTRDANDELLRIIGEFEEFYGLAAIPVAAGPDSAADEFERCLENGYHGGALETSSAGIELVDDEVQPVLEVANRTGAPLFVHPKIHDSVHEDALDDRYLLNAIFGREVALSESICNVIHEGIFERYPDLTLVYHHLGGNIAAMMERIRLQLDPGRWPGRQEHVMSYDAFRTQLEEQVYVDTAGFLGDSAPIRLALEEFPVTNVLLGTDAPYEPRTNEELRRFVSSIDQVCSPADANRVLGGNALELLVNVDR
ncbi:amidohydrolase family protein [Natronorubrum sp. JWXQ-INN-674]|uniref:Amidohydrolase family protein n=1 Tax=Natronorubrum halalkaliphilum TaxID=2691917 RepID=A0A6B0VPS9_9EURY|nr:amidohydrolase family protein [Natronorubrum halalkaliphilum]MXV63006.1 amidohydrolase family protein [Natronorubrum halalkaliphilum]